MAEWKVPNIWQDSRCFIIGGGPSIMDQFNVPSNIANSIMEREIPLSSLSPYLKLICNEHVIGVNNAYMIGNWIDVTFFGDCGWYLKHKDHLAKYSAIKVTCCSRFRNRPVDDPERIKFLARDTEKRHGITQNRKKVSWNKNSGGAAISLARHLGVRQIILIGFDMDINVDKGNWHSHWHGYHVELRSGKKDRRGNPKSRPTKQSVEKNFKRHLSTFPNIATDAKEQGIEILNANPYSKIDCFPRVNIQEVL